MADTLTRSELTPADAAAPTPQDQRRAQILVAARACFARSGFHGASMQEICAEAKMSPGALYRYYPSKDAIIAAIATDERSQVQYLFDILKGPGTIQERMFASALAYLKSMRDRSRIQLMLEICSESLRNTQVAARFAASEREVKVAFLHAAREAQIAGQIAADVEVSDAVRALMAFADGIVLRLGVDHDFDVDRAAPMLWRVLNCALRKDPEK